jgi:hypothetical protein
MFDVKVDRTESTPLHDQVAAEIRRAIPLRAPKDQPLLLMHHDHDHHHHVPISLQQKPLARQPDQLSLAPPECADAELELRAAACPTPILGHRSTRYGVTSEG